MDTPATSGLGLPLMDGKTLSKPPVEVKQIPEAPRLELHFYPRTKMAGTPIGSGCYWRRAMIGNK